MPFPRSWTERYFESSDNAESEETSEKQNFTFQDEQLDYNMDGHNTKNEVSHRQGEDETEIHHQNLIQDIPLKKSSDVNEKTLSSAESLKEKSKPSLSLKMIDESDEEQEMEASQSTPSKFSRSILEYPSDREIILGDGDSISNGYEDNVKNLYMRENADSFSQIPQSNESSHRLKKKEGVGSRSSNQKRNGIHKMCKSDEEIVDRLVIKTASFRSASTKSSTLDAEDTSKSNGRHLHSFSSSNIASESGRESSDGSNSSNSSNSENKKTRMNLQEMAILGKLTYKNVNAKHLVTSTRCLIPRMVESYTYGKYRTIPSHTGDDGDDGTTKRKKTDKPIASKPAQHGDQMKQQRKKRFSFFTKQRQKNRALFSSLVSVFRSKEPAELTEEELHKRHMTPKAFLIFLKSIEACVMGSHNISTHAKIQCRDPNLYKAILYDLHRVTTSVEQDSTRNQIVEAAVLALCALCMNDSVNAKYFKRAMHRRSGDPQNVHPYNPFSYSGMSLRSYAADNLELGPRISFLEGLQD